MSFIGLIVSHWIGVHGVQIGFDVFIGKKINHIIDVNVDFDVFIG